MRLEPLIAPWLLIPLLVAVVAFTVFQIVQFKQAKRGSAAQLVTRSATLLLLLLMLAGPSVPGGTSSPGIANLDILFVVDTTASMGAQDYNSGKLRLEGVKADMQALADRFPGASLGIVTFDSKASVNLPYTSDRSTFDAAVQTINRELFGTSKGSSIDLPVAIASEQLKNSEIVHPERSRLLFYMGDGEQTSKEEVASFDSLRSEIDGGAVLGYGTAEGAKMVRYTGLAASDKTQFVNTLDPSTKQFIPAVSKLSEESLNKLASEMGLSFINRNSGGDITAVYERSNAQVLIDNAKKIVRYINLYWLFAVLLGVLLFWDWRKVVLQYSDLRKQLRSSNG